jgi:C1A family cysteine protease
LAAILALVIVSVSGLVYEPKTAALTLEQQFDEYCAFWNKTYPSATERLARFNNFKASAVEIAFHNAKNAKAGKADGAWFGFSKYADWTKEEVLKLNGFRPSKPLQAPISAKRAAGKAPLLDAIDWVAAGKTTPVKDQGQCGSCWAFSTVETAESANLMAGKSVVPGSPQEVVDCDSQDAGCNGGDPQEALGWVVSNGLESEDAYPYQATDGTCAQDSSKNVLSIKQVVPVAGSESAIYNALKKYGPLSICADASQWSNYGGGVLTADQCGQDIDHAIQLTGYSPNNGGYWIVRNSWGSDWGENGFIRLQYGSNTCGITSEVTAATA